MVAATTDTDLSFAKKKTVSHHPPISAYFYVAPEHNVVVYGELRPKSRFLGNSAATLMGGQSRVVLLGRSNASGAQETNGEEYVIGMPNMYARGILFGKLQLELGDTSSIECPSTGVAASVEFKTKGYFSGTYNALEAKVLNAGQAVGIISGKWTDTTTYKDLRSSSGSHKEETLFSVQEAPTPAAKSVSPEAEQAPNESRRLWNGVTVGLHNKDIDAATEHKTAIEDAQRAATKKREEEGTEFHPHYFQYSSSLERFVPRIDNLPQEFQAEAVSKYFASLQD